MAAALDAEQGRSIDSSLAGAVRRRRFEYRTANDATCWLSRGTCQTVLHGQSTQTVEPMPIPNYQVVMLPLLRLASDGAERPFREAVERLSDEFALTDDERAELLPSGTANVSGSRVGWARTYLKQAGLLDAPKRGIFRITPEGKALLDKIPAKIDNNILNQYPSFRAFRARGKDLEDSAKPASVEVTADQTPEDAMAAAYQRVRRFLKPNFSNKSNFRRPRSLSDLLSILLLQWATVVRVKMQVVPLVAAAMAASTASSRKIDLVSM